jgi:hypothetical protein
MATLQRLEDLLPICDTKHFHVRLDKFVSLSQQEIHNLASQQTTFIGRKMWYNELLK